MMPENTVVGIDVAKEWLDVAVDGRVERIDNRPGPIRALARRLVRAGRTHVGMEPTGGYERLALALLREAGLVVLKVDTWRLRQFAKACGGRAKTDPLDARFIAAFLSRHEARPFPDPSESQLRLTAWSREIARAEAAIRSIENRRSHVELEPILRRLEAEVDVLRDTVAEAETAIAAILAEDNALARKAALIDTVPGLGCTTIRVALAEMPELGLLDARQAGALAGLAPYRRDSGKTIGRAHVEAGRDAIRRALFLAARAARLHNPWAKALHQRLRAAGKPDKVATIALARRLITIVNAMIRDNTPWRHHKLHAA